MILVHIEFKRVQTWLFSVPRLRAMLGANVLLGETIRVELPKLARQNGNGWKLAKNFVQSSDYPGADPNDPLKKHDNPAADAADGIVSRDGGHFEAWFSEGADRFVKEARMLLQSRLPGLRFEISQSCKSGDQNVAAVERRHSSHATMSTVLPIFSPCQWSERGLASTYIQQGDDEPLVVSLDVRRRHEAAKDAEDRTAGDLVSLLMSTTKMHGVKRPNDLQELTGTEYLAMIHADGNNVGGEAPRGDEAKRAAFFHRNRVLLRRALQAAIDEQCEEPGGISLLPLMLGGDDLLLVCRASLALSFVVSLCRHLDEIQRDTSGFRLTLGVGVVIAKQSVPIFRLHQVADTLASSAKRRYRGLVDEKKSVVDWAVYSPAWIDDPVKDRVRDWVHQKDRELYVLSRRPVDVLGNGLDSLQGLVKAAKCIESAPRSQFRYLVEQLFRGPTLAELAAAELSKEAKKALRRALGGGNRCDAAAHDSDKLITLWQSDENRRVTGLLDLVEIAEIAKLGRSERQACCE